MSTKDKPKFLIPAGIDVGSRNARIAIISESQSTPCIVPNEIGQRYTLALSFEEPKTEADPLNDQYWDKPKQQSSKEGESSAPTSVHYIHGDAARRALHRLKQPLKPHFVLNLIKDGAPSGPEEKKEDQIEGQDQCREKEEKENKLRAADAFFSHLSTQATHATGTTAHPSSLRYVLSVPTTQTCSETDALVQSVESGTRKCMKQVGYDTAPEILKTANLNKREKKQIIQEIESTNRVLAVITNPIAIGHAHGLFDFQSNLQSSESKSEPKWKNVLVVDWGASSMTLTHLRNLGSTELAAIEKTISESKSCGLNILNTLVSHTAEIFERNKRGMIPRGETLLNKKAKAKLEVACEDALRSFGYSPKAHVTVDGLIDGIDCQVEIMLARFEMLLAPALRTAEAMIRDFITSSGVEFDGILSSGGIMRMKCVESMMNRLFHGKWRGQSIGDVAPEEAVALGCVRFAQTILEFSVNHCNIAAKSDQTTEEDVELSPIGIGLCLQEGDPAAVVMIEKNTPLPALVTKHISLAGCSPSLGLIQLSNGAEKLIGKVEGIDVSATSLEITMELSCEGQLSVVVNGGSSFVI